MSTTKITKKEKEYICELIAEAWMYKRSTAKLSVTEQERLYLKISSLEIEE